MKSSECYPNGTCRLHETYSRTNYLKNSKCGCPLGYNKPYVPEDIQNGDMKDCEKILSRLNGKKRLILGNHDVGKLKYLQPYFQKIDGVRNLNIKGFKFIMSHIPLHFDCVDKFGINIHGHLHNNIIKDTDIITAKVPDKRGLYSTDIIEIEDKNYFNVSVERTDYKPINLEEIKQKCKD